MAIAYQVAEVNKDSEIGYQPFGGSLKFWHCKDHECLISGPAETGKTFGALQKLDGLAWKYPGYQGAIVRKTYKSIIGSVLQTYIKKVLGAWDKERNRFDQSKTPVKAYGGEKPEWFDYPNGSRIFIVGLDNPDKVLSSELDGIYVNQAEELLLDDWEKLATRCTGRAGNMPYPQLMGDANPGASTHWILQRMKAGTLTLIESRHEDNPTLFNQETGEITEQGKRSMAVLDNLTGSRKQRLRYGKWTQAEGVVYDSYDPSVHLIDRFEIPKDWRRIRLIDFGFTNPFVCQWWAIDPDGRMYLYREIYMSQRTVKVHSGQIKSLSEGETYEATITDHDAEDRATLAENGISTIPAKKDISPGIQAVQQRLKIADDGKPRFYILRDSLVEADWRMQEARKPICTEEEFSGYIWPKGVDGKAVKEVPVKENDHGMDGMRYAAMYIDGPKATLKITKNPFYS